MKSLLISLQMLDFICTVIQRCLIKKYDSTMSYVLVAFKFIETYMGRRRNFFLWQIL